MSSEDRICPECGGHVSTAVGMGWGDATGRLHAWVGTCEACNVRTDTDHTFGIDSTGQLMRVEAVLFDDIA